MAETLPVSTTSAAAFVIALDGPAASGKSTVGGAVAERLGFFYLDTGLLYRALTWAALERAVDVADPEAMATLAQGARLEVRPPTRPDGRQVDLLLDGRDITQDVRRPEVDRHVSVAAAHPGVRAAMRSAQRAAIRRPGTVLAGRDIGTVIVPEAPLKVWLTASSAERARRRAAQTGEDGAAVLQAMRRRDRLDASRATAPMVPAADAVQVQTDGLTPEQVAERIVSLARARMGDADADRRPRSSGDA